LYFLYTATNQNPQRISVVSEKANGTDAPNAEWTIRTDANWLTFGLQQNGSDRATILSGTGSSSNIYVFVERNNSTSARQTEIYLEGSDAENTKVIVIQDSNTDNDGYGTPPHDVRTYVGAFWRANERGERLIRIEAGAHAGNYGDWTARVLWMDERWENDEIQLDTEMIDEVSLANRGISFTADMNPDAAGSPENFSVNGHFASGNVSAANRFIFFRIGLSSLYTPTEAHPVRYAVVLLSYKDNTMHQKIFLRQGEGADYMLTNSDPVNVPNIPGQGLLTQRTRTVKFSPYNLTTDGFVGTNPVTVSGQVGKFIDYPTKTGAFWLWGDSPTTGNLAYNPFTATAPQPPTATTNHWNGATNAMAAANENCPVGYRRPIDGSTTSSDSNPNLSNSEIRQSLWVRPKTGYNHNDVAADNSAWGFYADGFFDRRRIVLSSSSAITYPTAVAYNTPDIAHIGRLFFNPLPDSEHYYASLFFPFTGSRSINNGYFTGGGYTTSYWTASSSTTAVLGASALRIFDDRVGVWNTEKNAASPIRCVRD
jgi:hypothetical protein